MRNANHRACARAAVSGISRRRLLQIGSLGVTGLGLPQLLAAADSTGPRPRADACILIYLNGGPSHLDMWDMKPQAATGIRGEFQPIASSLPGLQLCEHLPQLARQMHRATVVRSMHHSVNNSHAAAVYASLTGHDRGEIGGGTSTSDNPSPGAVLSRFRPTDPTVLPQVHLPYITKEGAGGPPQPGFFGGFLGRAWDPLFVLKDPSAPDFGVPELSLQTDVSSQRLSARRQLLGQVDQQFAENGDSTGLLPMTQFQSRALDILSSEKTQQAFRISAEPPAMREAYGNNIYGQSVLLARRLIEAGTRMVTVSWAPDANATWDTHGGNFQKLRDTLLPQFDAASASLIDDLAQRGMLERTLVAVLGDFGRTPKINANAGRDHWNHCYSVMLAGGGFQPGLVFGSSDSIGGFPDRDPLIPGDIVSTMYKALGIQHDSWVPDQLGRPHRLVPTGDVVERLLA